MWICQNCGTENEEKFKFCWSCGQTRKNSKPIEIKEEIKEIPNQTEPKKESIREVGKVEEIEEIEEIKPAQIPKAEPRKIPQNETELFATVLPYSVRNSTANDETDWEIKVFRIALRLVGLFLLYQVFVALPDLVNAIYSIYEQNSSNADKIFTKEFFFPIAKLLFYFIVGIYLIASGRILIWLLPNR